MSELLIAKELATKLKVTAETIHTWHRQGRIPCLRASRRPVLFDYDEVIAALKKRALVGEETSR